MTKKDPALKSPISYDTGEVLESPAGYDALLQDIKERIRTARVRASLAVNKQLVLLYWGIGRDILQRQQQQGWVLKLSSDLLPILDASSLT